MAKMERNLGEGDGKKRTVSKILTGKKKKSRQAEGTTQAKEKWERRALFI